MSPLRLLAFLLSICAAICENYTFMGFSCTKIMATKIIPPYKDLLSAYSGCVGMANCVGVRQQAENSFVILGSDFTNIISSDWCGDLLLDRSNGTVLANAPSFFHSKMLYGIYYYRIGSSDPMCPFPFQNANGRCERKQTTEELCKRYPSFMDAKFYPATGVCSVASLKDIETMWA